MTESRRWSMEEWDEYIENYRSSGLTAAQWCEINGFKPNQLRWQITKRQKLHANSHSTQWIPLHTESSSTSPKVSVKIGQAEIVVSDGFNKELFTEVVHSLLKLC